jgi:hypothetical protein
VISFELLVDAKYRTFQDWNENSKFFEPCEERFDQSESATLPGRPILFFFQFFFVFVCQLAHELHSPSRAQKKNTKINCISIHTLPQPSIKKLPNSLTTSSTVLNPIFWRVSFPLCRIL